MTRSQIFKAAHQIRKSTKVTLSVALKLAWAAAKGQCTAKGWAKGDNVRVYYTSVNDTRVSFFFDLNKKEKIAYKGYERNLAKRVNISI